MPFSEDQIKQNLSNLPGWQYINGQIQKTFSLRDFKAALNLINLAGSIAEQQNHHPDVNLRFNKVTFMLSTHDEDGVTDKDFNLANEIERAASNYE